MQRNGVGAKQDDGNGSDQNKDEQAALPD